jgi:hypothetical protein
MVTAGTRLRLTVFVLFFTIGCSSNPPPPGPGESWGAVPDLRGHRVLLLPVQLEAGVPPDLNPDAELAHAVRSRGGSVDWVLPEEAEEVVRRAPGLNARVTGLPVGIFLQARVKRVGDPLFRDVRQLAELTGAEVTLIPVEVRYGEGEGYQVAAAILNPRSGRVYWYGVVEGEAGSAEDPRALASMADALARALFPLE